MSRTILNTFVALCFISQFAFSAGAEGPQYKRTFTTPKRQTVHSGCEPGCYNDAVAEVGQSEAEPEEPVAMAHEIPEDPPAPPIVEEDWEAPTSSPTYKMFPSSAPKPETLCPATSSR